MYISCFVRIFHKSSTIYFCKKLAVDSFEIFLNTNDINFYKSEASFINLISLNFKFTIHLKFKASSLIEKLSRDLKEFIKVMGSIENLYLSFLNKLTSLIYFFSYLSLFLSQISLYSNLFPTIDNHFYLYNYKLFRLLFIIFLNFK